MINGYQVYLEAERDYPGGPIDHVLTAPDADGVDLFLSVPDAHPVMSLADVFADHMRLLGPNPDDWTTTPISA